MDKTQNPPSALAISAHSGPGPEIRLSIKISEYAARHSVCSDTVFVWLRSGMPHLKIAAKCTRIPVVEADRWVQQTFYRQRHH